jgi:hypothetical protein
VVHGIGCRVEGLEFGMQPLEHRAEGLGFYMQRLGCRV